MNLPKLAIVLKRLTFIVLISLTIFQAQGSEEGVSELVVPIAVDTHSVAHYKAYEKSIAQIKELISIIMKVMDELYMHENYWKTQKLTPLAYFLSKDPTKWVYRKQEWQKIDSSIAFLECEQEYHASYLAQFKIALTTYEDDPHYSESKLIQSIQVLEKFLSHYPHAMKVYGDNEVSETYAQRVDRNAYLISYYLKNARRAVAHCSEPNHFQRNWLGYFIGTAALVGAGYFMYKNQSKLQSWADTGIEGLKKYYHEHVSSPIVDSLKTLFQRNRKPLMTQEGVDASEESFLRQISTYLDLEHPDLSLEKRQEILDQAVVGNLNFLLKDWDESLQLIFDASKGVEGTSIYSKYKRAEIFFNNLPNGLNIGRLMDIRVHAKDVMLNKAMLEVETQINANKFNFEIAAALPSALVGYLMYGIGKFLFTKIVLQKNTYQPLRYSLHHLHMIYDRNAPKNNPFSITDKGFCIYWIERFKKYSVQLPLAERKMILDDLAELESDSFNATQKLSIIQRMYYNYHFLSPSLN